MSKTNTPDDDSAKPKPVTETCKQPLFEIDEEGMAKVIERVNERMKTNPVNIEEYYTYTIKSGFLLLLEEVERTMEPVDIEDDYGDFDEKYE